MENKASKDLAVLGNQLELFQSTRTLNLSENYEAIPKHVNSNDPDIEWRTDEIAKPVNKNFEWSGKTFTCELEPAYFEDKHGVFRSHFPELREARVEYAIISLASKSLLHIDMDSENNKIFVLKTSYYQIQKEIVEAINTRTNKNLKPNSCPYNTTAIQEALMILKKSVSTIRDPEISDKKEGYVCNRIKDFYYSEKKLVIELGNFVTSYISSGDWKATDSDSILASTGMYELKMRVLLNMKFRYASRGMKYSPSIDKLVREIQFVEHKEKRITLQKVVILLEKMHEVDRVVLEKKYEGRKLAGAIVHIFASDSFIQTMIDNNALTKRTATPLLVEETGEIMLEPVRSQYPSSSEYQKAMSVYKVEQGKMLHKVRHDMKTHEAKQKQKWEQRKEDNIKTFFEGS